MPHHVSRRSGVGTLVLLAALAVGSLPIAGAPLRAQDSTATRAPRLTIHGFVAQGVGRATDHALRGLGEGATADLRAAALQVRYAPTDADALILQLDHRRLGGSPLAAIQKDVAIDWGFYQHTFRHGTAVKLGKVPLPMGIYNEVRHVGTVLPLYTAPHTAYLDGMETVDGATIGHALGAASRWTLDAVAVLGAWDYAEVAWDSAGASVTRARDRHTVGGQLWLTTPLRALRVGLGGMRYEQHTVTSTPPSSPDGPRRALMASVDATFDRWFLRAEHLQDRHVGERPQYRAHYAQVGLRPANRVWLYGQVERAQVRVGTAPQTLDLPYMRDAGLGLSFAPRASVTLKLEAHRARGLDLDEPTDPFAPPPRTGYGIASVAFSF